MGRGAGRLYSPDALLGHNSADPAASMFGDRQTHVCMYVYMYLCLSKSGTKIGTRENHLTGDN